MAMADPDSRAVLAAQDAGIDLGGDDYTPTEAEVDQFSQQPGIQQLFDPAVTGMRFEPPARARRQRRQSPVRPPPIKAPQGTAETEALTPVVDSATPTTPLAGSPAGSIDLRLDDTEPGMLKRANATFFGVTDETIEEVNKELGKMSISGSPRLQRVPSGRRSPRRPPSITIPREDLEEKTAEAGPFTPSTRTPTPRDLAVQVLKGETLRTHDGKVFGLDEFVPTLKRANAVVYPERASPKQQRRPRSPKGLRPGKTRTLSELTGCLETEDQKDSPTPSTNSNVPVEEDIELPVIAEDDLAPAVPQNDQIHNISFKKSMLYGHRGAVEREKHGNSFRPTLLRYGSNSMPQQTCKGLFTSLGLELEDLNKEEPSTGDKPSSDSDNTRRRLVSDNVGVIALLPLALGLGYLVRRCLRKRSNQNNDDFML